MMRSREMPASAVIVNTFSANAGVKYLKSIQMPGSVFAIASASASVYGAYTYLNLSHPLIGITADEQKLKSWWAIDGRFPEKFGEVVLGSVEAAVFAQKSGEYTAIGDTITVTA